MIYIYNQVSPRPSRLDFPSNVDERFMRFEEGEGARGRQERLRWLRAQHAQRHGGQRGQQGAQREDGRGAWGRKG